MLVLQIRNASASTRSTIIFCRLTNGRPFGLISNSAMTLANQPSSEWPSLKGSQMAQRTRSLTADHKGNAIVQDGHRKVDPAIPI